MMKCRMWQNNPTALSNVRNLMKEMGKDAYLTTLWVENIKLEAKDRALYSSWLSCFLQAYMLTNLKSLHFVYLYCINMWTTDGAIQVFSLLEFEITDKPKEKARMNHIILRYMDEQNVVKRKEILPFVTIRWTWRTLSKISQTQKDKYSMISLKWNIRCSHTETGNRMVAARGSEEREVWSCCLRI